MAFDVSKMPGFLRTGSKAELTNRKTAPGIDQQRKKVSDTIKNHVRVYVDNKAEMIDVLDDTGVPTGKKRKERVMCLSKPIKGDDTAVGCELKYGPTMSVDIGNGQEPIVVKKTQEGEFWAGVLQVVEAGDLDKEIAAAAQNAAPKRKG